MRRGLESAQSACPSAAAAPAQATPYLSLQPILHSVIDCLQRFEQDPYTAQQPWSPETCSGSRGESCEVKVLHKQHVRLPAPRLHESHGLLACRPQETWWRAQKEFFQEPYTAQYLQRPKNCSTAVAHETAEHLHTGWSHSEIL